MRPLFDVIDANYEEVLRNLKETVPPFEDKNRYEVKSWEITAATLCKYIGAIGFFTTVWFYQIPPILFLNVGIGSLFYLNNIDYRSVNNNRISALNDLRDRILQCKAPDDLQSLFLKMHTLKQGPTFRNNARTIFDIDPLFVNLYYQIYLLNLFNQVRARTTTLTDRIELIANYKQYRVYHDNEFPAVRKIRMYLGQKLQISEFPEPTEQEILIHFNSNAAKKEREKTTHEFAIV